MKTQRLKINKTILTAALGLVMSALSTHAQTQTEWYLKAGAPFGLDPLSSTASEIVAKTANGSISITKEPHGIHARFIGNGDAVSFTFEGEKQPYWTLIDYVVTFTPGKAVEPGVQQSTTTAARSEPPVTATVAPESTPTPFVMTPALIAQDAANRKTALERAKIEAAQQIQNLKSAKAFQNGE